MLFYAIYCTNYLNNDELDLDFSDLMCTTIFVVEYKYMQLYRVYLLLRLERAGET